MSIERCDLGNPLSKPMPSNKLTVSNVQTQTERDDRIVLTKENFEETSITTLVAYEGDNFISEQLVIATPSSSDLFDVSGETLRSFTSADISCLQDKLVEYESYRSEVSVDDIYNNISFLGDKVRTLPSELFSQLEHLSTITKVLSDSVLVESVNFDAKYLADLTSQALMALKLLSSEPSMSNLTLVFTCVLSKLDLSRERMAQCIDFVKDALHVAVSSISTLGYKSESAISAMINSFKAMCTKVCDIAEDRVIEIVLTFLAKLVSFWTTVSGGFTEDDFDISNLPKVVDKMRDILRSGGDLVECILGAYDWITTNFYDFIKGDFSAFFFGKAETGAFESRVSKVKRIYPIVASGSCDILKEEYGHTYSSYDLEVANLVVLGDRMMVKAKSVQRPALKRMIDELREIQVDRRMKQSLTQTKISSMGVCFVGPSGVGKSLLMDSTSRTLICAAGEVPTSEKIVTGQMSDKFDSNELPHHLSIQYDDVANNSQNENFDKLLNAVNSQSRPFLKAGVEDKGIMFPGNVACVISTNVPGLNAKKSNCPDSIARRFLHIHTSIKPSVVKEVCVPGTKRVDPVRASVNGSARMDIWKFDVYEFITFGLDKGEVLDPDVILWEGMYVRPLVWTSKPLSDQTFWDLALFLKDRAKKHFSSQRSLLATMLSRQHEEYCTECCVPNSMCLCGTKSEYTSASIDVGIDRLASRYSTYTSFLERWWDVAKIRAVITLSYSLAPTDYKRNLKISFATGAYVGLVCFRNPLYLLAFLITWCPLMMSILVFLAWRDLYHQMQHRVGILTHYAEDSVAMVRRHRNQIFAGVTMVSFAYLLYKAFRPKSELVGYREALPENVRNAFVRAEKARTTPIDNILPHMKRDLGTITVTQGKSIKQCLAFPIESNFYVTVGHIIPKEGDFEIFISHENALTPTVAKQKLSPAHVYRFPKKDLVLIQVPSAVPRRGYKDYLLGRECPLGSQAVSLVSMRMDDKVRYISATRMEPGWSMFSSSVSTDLVTLHKPYKYNAPQGTFDGMCGSLIVDFSKAIIYGFHVAGNGKVGLCDTLTQEDVQLALTSFRGFMPANRGDLQLGSNSLEKGLGFVTLKIGDETFDKPPEDHNCVTEGVLEGASATFKNPYLKHPFKEAIVEEFGPPKFCPPQDINSHFHKRKALTKLTTPNQEFSLGELEFAARDYRDPILSMVNRLPDARKREVSRVLPLQEALDGISEKALNGIDNSTSVGFPYRGKKKNFLERDPLDPTIPMMPRQLVDYGGVTVTEEMDEMLSRYKCGQSCRTLFKCSMKTDELLPNTKVKARIVMGCNFPFLLLCRQYLSPIIRLMSENKLLFESAKGINMDSVEAEELHDYLLVEDGERVVALDYSAFDQTMSAQASTTAAGIIIDIMRELGCSEEHITVARGILTDITYPNLHYFGTVIQLANSDPSGNPITTELNGMVNSLYLRTFFFRIYPGLRNKVSYRSAIKTATYGDDNINGVPRQYEEFNGVRIVEEGAKCGLQITMADKTAKVVKFTNLYDSDFLKRKFRRCPVMGRIRAPLAKDSIEKSIHWIKRTSPDPPEVLFAQNVDGMLRKAGQYDQDYFDEIRGKLLRIAEAHDVVSICKWWTYDELIQHDKFNYYDHYNGVSLYDSVSDEQVISDYLSEAKKRQIYNPTIMLIKLFLSVGFTTFASVEVADWYMNKGGRDTLYKNLADRIRSIRKVKDGIDTTIDDRIAVPFALDGAHGVARDLGVPLFVAKWIVLVTLWKTDEPGFRSESFVVPPDKANTILSRVISFLMEWIIALLPFANTGRYSEIGLTSGLFTLAMTCSAVSQYCIDVDNISLFDRSALSRLGYFIKQALVKQWLRDDNDIIRKQPLCLLLEGGAGVGKTTCALALVKKLIPDIKKRDLIVLNEDDDFQSELRSNHRVIVMDDVLNTSRKYLISSPMRRVIDIVNNTPRRALSPEVDLKGNIKVKPDLVILTSNVPVSVLLSFTECPDSFMRRWRRLVVYKVRPFSSDFDTTAWEFEEATHKSFPVTMVKSTYNDLNGYNQVGPRKTYDELSSELVQVYDTYQRDQESLVRMVNDHFREPTLYDRFRGYLPSHFKSEQLDWDTELYYRLKDQELNPSNFLDNLLSAGDGLVVEHGVSAFHSVPRGFHGACQRQTWWQWLRTQLCLDTFRSEALSPAQQFSLLHIRQSYMDDPTWDVVVEEDFILFLSPRGYSQTIASVKFTTPQGIHSFAGNQYLLNDRYASLIDLRSSPCFLDSFQVIAFYAWHDEMSGFKSQSSEVDPIDLYTTVYGVETIGAFLASRSDDLVHFVYSYKKSLEVLPPCGQPLDTSTHSFEGYDRKDGVVTDEFLSLMKKVECSITVQTIPSYHEEMSQYEVISKMAGEGHELLAQEVLISFSDVSISCDLVFRKGDSITFIEAKRRNPSKVKDQAILRRKALSPILAFLPQYVFSFGYYCRSDGKLEII